VPTVPALWPVYLVPATLTFAYAFITTYRLAPVASANKPIERKEKILRLRRLSFLTIAAFYVISVTLIFLGGTYPRCINAAISLCMAVLWQSFMLTKAADKFIGYLDSPGSAR
jgi:accessory gene regulator B